MENIESQALILEVMVQDTRGRFDNVFLTSTLDDPSLGLFAT